MFTAVTFYHNSKVGRVRGTFPTLETAQEHFGDALRWVQFSNHDWYAFGQEGREPVTQQIFWSR